MGSRFRQALRNNARRVITCSAFAALASSPLAACSRSDAASESQAVAVSASASNAATKALNSSSTPVAPPNAAPQAKQAPCDALCARTAELRCGATAADCMTGCLEMAGAPVCKAEMLAVLNCMNQHTAADWECDHSMASIRPGFCEAEQARVASCISGMN